MLSFFIYHFFCLTILFSLLHSHSLVLFLLLSYNFPFLLVITLLFYTVSCPCFFVFVWECLFHISLLPATRLSRQFSLFFKWNICYSAVFYLYFFLYFWCFIKYLKYRHTFFIYIKGTKKELVWVPCLSIVHKFYVFCMCLRLLVCKFHWHLLFF